MRRRVISLVIAAAASVVGLTLLWIGGAQVLQTVQEYVSGGPWAAPGGAAIAVVGVLLLGVAGFSVAWSSLGAIVVGAVHVIGSAVAILLPVGPGAAAPVWDALFSLGDISLPLELGAITFTARGAGIVTGCLLIGGGIAAARRQPAALRVRVIVAIVSALVLAASIVFALAQGSRVYLTYLVFIDADLTAGLLLIGSAVAAGAAMASLRWTSLGAYVVGGALVVWGVLVAVQPDQRFFAFTPLESQDLTALGVIGALQAIGAVLIGLGIGAARRHVD